METETLLLVFLAVTVVALAIEAFAVRRTLRVTSETLGRFTALSSDLEKDAKELMAQLQNVGTGLDHLHAVFEELGDRVHDVNQMIAGRSQDLSQLVERLVELGNREAEKVDEVVTDTVEKFRQTTDTIRDDILQPVVEIASLIRGIRAGVEYLFAPQGRRPGEPGLPDEEMFI